MKIKVIYIWLGLLLLSSCSANKYLTEEQRFHSGEQFFYDSDTLAINKKRVSVDLSRVLEPQPNAKIFGSRPGVWFYYNIGEPKKEKGLKQWMKKNFAKTPVLQSDVKPNQMSRRAEDFLINEGYFRNEVENKVITKKNKSKVEYYIKTGPGYTLSKINYPELSDYNRSLIEEIQKESILKPGMRYRLEDLESEQKRIENYLEDHGYYYFDDKYLIYLADSTVGEYKVELTLELSEKTPAIAKKSFGLSDVFISPNYSLESDTTNFKNRTEEVDTYLFVDNDDYIRPDILAKTVVFKKGDIYSQQAEKKTRERLMSLGTYKFVNVRFNKSDSAQLKSEIFLTPLPKKSIRLDLQAITNSNNFVGPAFSTSFQNRNTFRGAELFELKLNASYEVQIGGQNKPPLNAYELNLEGSVTIPRLITPFNINYRSLQFIPQTRIALSIRQQRRLNVFQINSFEGQYGFIWQESYTKQHKFYPVNISYVELGDTSPEFDERLEQDPNLKRSLEDQFILGMLYEYTFSSKNAEKKSNNRHNFYFNGLIDLSGNLANAATSLVGIPNAEEGKITYSQYSKLQLDFRHFRKLGKNNEFASRLLLGAARAYGNSTDVPFIKQFSSGGSNSIRAFRARSLGPGSYINDESSDLVIDETGDIKIEANVEYRADLGGVFESAIFLDAGNVWLWDARPEVKPGGEFDNDFLDDVAVGTGLGLRLDFSFFLLRFDLAFPIRKPLDTGVEWVFKDINPLDRNWRKDNLLLNIAIGYPF